METFLPEVKKNNYPVGLTPELALSLETWEDHISAYIQLTEKGASISWIKADVLLHLTEKFGNDSLLKISGDIGEPVSTVTGYVRVARAFPVDKRDPAISFSHCYQASFSDSYDEKSGQFSSEKRFDWIDKAIENNLSTRDLRDEIQEQKQKDEHPGLIEKCDMCHQNGSHIEKFVFFIPNSGKAGDKFKLHPKCYDKLLNFISEYGEPDKEDII